MKGTEATFQEFIDETRPLPGFSAGRAEAEKDIAAGILKQRAFGKLVAWWEDVAQLLQERHGIGYEIVAGCVVEQEVATRAMGYNERMNLEIQARFGRDVVSATFREVERQRKKHRHR